METLATLAMDIDVRSADPAEAKLQSLTRTAKVAEDQFGRTAAASKAGSVAMGLAGTAAGQAEKSMRDLTQVYGVARDALGRFTAVDGSFRHSQEATALMAIRNAQAQASLAKEQAKAEAQVASLTKKYDSLRAELDPLAAIQTTLAKRTELLSEALSRGVITGDQHAAMLSKVTRAALAGVQGVEKYTGGLRNGGQHLTQFSFQLNDIATGLASGQKPMQVLAQQSGQIIQIFQQAAVEAGGFKAAVKGLTAEVLPFLATFGPWIAGLTAVGAAVFYVVDQHNKQAKAIEDATKRLDEQRKSLGQISPLLNQAKMDADLAADGQRNFDEWLRKTNVSLAEQIRLQRIKTLNDTNDAALKAAEELRKNQEIFDKLNKPGTQMGFSTGVGGFSTISAATAVNKESEAYKKAAANLKAAREDVDRLNERLAKQGQAPDLAFGKQTESATRAASAVREVSKAAEDYGRRAAPIEESALAKASEVYWPEAAAAAEAYAKQQDAVKTAQGDTIRTINDALPPAEKLTRTIYELAYAYERAFQSAGDFATAIARGDFGGALTGASRTLQDVSDLLGPTSKLGSLLGSAGAALGPVGAAVGAVTSVLGVIGERSAAKAQAKLDALTKGVENLRADNKTSSGSIAGALAVANANWNADLEYSSAMVTSLRSIDNQIGSLANALGRSISGGLLSTAGLGLGSTGSTTGSVFGAVTGLLFGNSKTKTELLDQGLNFNPTTFGALGAGGLTGSTYADLVTTKTKSLLGVDYSTKVKTSTVNGAIGGDLLSQISGVIQALGDGVLSAAAVFGAEAAKSAEAALGSAVVDLGKLSLKDLKPDEIAEVLNATFDKVADQLAAAGVPGLDKLASVGEGAFETLTRLAREYQVVDVALASIGKQFKTVGVESLAARDYLVQLFGGADAFTSATSFFATNFLTDAQRLEPVVKAVNDNLKQFGLSATSSREEFTKLVLGLDVSTEAGANAYKTLLSIAPAFDKVATTAEAATKATEDLSRAQQSGLVALYDAQGRTAEATALRRAQELAAITDPVQKKYLEQTYAAADAAEAVTDARSVLTDAYNAEKAAIEATRDKFADLAKTLRDFSSSLSAKQLEALGPAARYAATRSAFTSAASRARLGDSDAAALIPSLGEAYRQAAEDTATSQIAYLRDLSAIKRATTDAADTADRQVDNAERQLEALDQQVAGLIEVNKSVMSVHDAVINLTAALAVALSAGVKSVGGSSLGLSGNGLTAGYSTSAVDFWGALTGGLGGAAGAGMGGIPADVGKALGLPGFSSGGSFQVGGMSGTDQNILSVNGVPFAGINGGEAVNVSRKDVNAALLVEIRALNQTIKGQASDINELKKSNAQLAADIHKVTEAGQAMRSKEVA